MFDPSHTPNHTTDPPSAAGPGEPCPPQIAVVIVAYNSRDDLALALPALRHGLRNYRYALCLIDNASRDGSVDYVREEQRLDPHIQLVINSRNRGYTAAINQGLDRVGDAEYVLLLNPDVLIPPTTIPILLQEMEKDPTIGVIAPQMRRRNGDVLPSCRRFPLARDVFSEWLPHRLLHRLWPGYSDWKMSDFDHLSSRDVDQPQGAFLLVRRRTLANVGRLDERFFMFFSDVDFCRRVIEAGWRIRFYAGAFVYHQAGSAVRKCRPAMLASSHRSFVHYLRAQAHGPVQKFGILVVTLWLLILLPPRLLLAHLQDGSFLQHQ
ncbi:MAG: N-acetylglucosaminyl-diphospho-decaprenol L-rhamnosyltransferase [bacterium ADurb.Bin478]|nr:MAG: N-acetylglucosaminyl-diphospho-decaprenol L-rhamnosyltransferase [bacterium ADurb.Bin478]